MLDCGRYAPSACVGETVAVSADVFRDGHEMLRAVVATGARRATLASRRRCAPIDAHIDGVRWAGEFAVDTPGRWQFDDRGVERPLRHLARRAAPQDRRRPGGPRRRALRGRRAARARRASAREGRRQGADRGGARGARERRRRRQPQVDAALAPELFAADGARLRSARARRRSTARSPLEVDRVRARFGSWYELFPRSLGRPARRSRSWSPRSPSSASTSSTCRRSTRSARRTARAATTR